MLDEKSFDYILFGIIGFFTLYTMMNNNEKFTNESCSDNAINAQIFDYVLYKNNKKISH